MVLLKHLRIFIKLIVMTKALFKTKKILLFSNLVHYWGRLWWLSILVLRCCVSNLVGSDSGHYRCTLNFNKKALHVEHKLLVQGIAFKTLVQLPAKPKNPFLPTKFTLDFYRVLIFQLPPVFMFWSPLTRLWWEKAPLLSWSVRLVVILLLMSHGTERWAGSIKFKKFVSTLII